MVTRVPIMDVRPQIEGGRYAVKAVEHEEFTVRARIVGEGRSVVRAAVVMAGPDGVDRPRVTMTHVGHDQWAALVSGDAVGAWSFRLESWHDPVATWARDAQVRIAADVDVELTLADGAAVLRRASDADPAAAGVAEDLLDSSLPAVERLATALTLIGTLDRGAVRDHVDSTGTYPVFVDRERALVGSWYEMFPRSEGSVRTSDGRVRAGTLRTASKRLEGVAAMGFDVVCLPPIHPIGTTGRRGPGHRPAGPDDPGSPWAIGSSAGGHDAVHPDLGTLTDFDSFVERAHQLGIEVALDLALDCSPDHPWVTEHPEWFATRADGSIAHAEQPTRSSGDIHPLDFDADPAGLYLAVLQIVGHWIDHGVRIFRVDHPHTKPVAFWEQLLADVREIDPDIIFLAETFTSPAMLHTLGAVGFHQSYTCFSWREGAAETADYLDEVSNRASDVMRPNFFVNTPDVLPRYLQGGDESMFRMRAVLAATGSPSWGMYAGYELMEHTPAGPDSEEYRDSEKYAIAVRDWEDPASLAPFIARLNEVRRAHPALRRLRNLAVHRTDQSGVIAFSKVTDDDVVLVVLDLFPAFTRTVGVDVDPRDLGLRHEAAVVMVDEVDGSTCRLDAVPLDTQTPARVLVVDRR